MKSRNTPARAVVPASATPAAPDFRITTIDGQSFALDVWRGRALVLLFLTRSCPTCSFEAEMIAQLSKHYRARGVDALAIDVDPSSTEAELRAFRADIRDGDTYLWALDRGGELARAFQIRALDTTIILDPDRRVSLRKDVPLRFDQLEEAIQPLLR